MNVRNSFGLEFIGGKSESVAARPHKFTPVRYQIIAAKREGPLKLCSAATMSVANKFTALIFWFILDQAKMNTTFFRYDNLLPYMNIPWSNKDYMDNVRDDMRSCIFSIV